MILPRRGELDILKPGRVRLNDFSKLDRVMNSFFVSNREQTDNTGLLYFIELASGSDAENVHVKISLFFFISRLRYTGDN